MSRAKVISTCNVEVSRGPTSFRPLHYTARADEHGRFIYDEGVFCYEAREDGSLILYPDRGDGESVEVIIPANDVSRLIHAAIDALQKKEGRR